MIYKGDDTITIIHRHGKYVLFNLVQVHCKRVIAQHAHDLLYSFGWNMCGFGVRLMHADSVNQEEFPFSPLSWKLLELTGKGAPSP